ncbi:MAG: Rrf2 family transcriptional regulator [Candidatus Dadabacteria bacterium]|nr:MAG: Rrf2 family transcriptional regulator [Candidatus Dadabacteria bacterium]
MKITRWAEYGIHCAAFIAAETGAGRYTVSATEISNSQNIPLDYTRQILQRLKQGGLIQTVRGPAGGYRLTKAPYSITLGEIIRAAEGEVFEIVCESNPIGKERCDDSIACGIRPIWYKLHEHINSFLNSYTLKDVLDNKENDLVVIKSAGKRG